VGCRDRTGVEGGSKVHLFTGVAGHTRQLASNAFLQQRVRLALPPVYVDLRLS
jgi:hypothetical protein